VLYITENTIFAGDTLFRGSAGRTDGYGGCSATQRESLTAIRETDGDFRVLTGHGAETTLEEERRGNPFLMAESDFWRL
jgi:glyoxylase-like metal-dependent hydrolase (beta-lactamase superfamily II)